MRYILLVPNVLCFVTFLSQYLGEMLLQNTTLSHGSHFNGLTHHYHPSRLPKSDFSEDLYMRTVRIWCAALSLRFS